MEKGKHSIDVTKKTVTFGHVTQTKDGEVLLTTTFDFSKVSDDRLLFDAGSARLIRWRASSGVKKLTTAEATEKFNNIVVDCSATVVRAKHVETAEEKALKDAINAKIASGAMSMADIAKLIAEAKASKETESQDEMEAGEDSTPAA